MLSRPPRTSGPQDAEPAVTLTCPDSVSGTKPPTRGPTTALAGSQQTRAPSRHSWVTWHHGPAWHDEAEECWAGTAGSRGTVAQPGTMRQRNAGQVGNVTAQWMVRTVSMSVNVWMGCFVLTKFVRLCPDKGPSLPSFWSMRPLGRSHILQAAVCRTGGAVLSAFGETMRVQLEASKGGLLGERLGLPDLVSTASTT